MVQLKSQGSSLLLSVLQLLSPTPVSRFGFSVFWAWHVGCGFLLAAKCLSQVVQETLCEISACLCVTPLLFSAGPGRRGTCLERGKGVKEQTSRLGRG